VKRGEYCGAMERLGRSERVNEGFGVVFLVVGFGASLEISCASFKVDVVFGFPSAIIVAEPFDEIHFILSTDVADIVDSFHSEFTVNKFVGIC
jgi:hypothetical protein